MESCIEELMSSMDEVREEMQGALNEAINNVTKEGESRKSFLFSEIVALKEDN